MSTLKISLFGNLTCTDSNGYTLEIEPRKAQELFAYLLLYHQQLHDREKLASLFWSELRTSQSKRNLRQTLWQLQSALNRHQKRSSVFHIEHHQIGIDPNAQLWLDVMLFDQTVSAVNKIQGTALTVNQVEQIENAVHLYTGDLLEGWYCDWCIYERERYQMYYLALLDKLTEYHEFHGQYDMALDYGHTVLKYDRARERTHRQLMRLQYLAGHRTQALHQYDACVTALAEELGVPPAQSTIALYDQICADRVLANPPLHSEASSAYLIATEMAHATEDLYATEDPSLDTREELEQIQATLGLLQQRINQLILHLDHHDSRQA